MIEEFYSLHHGRRAVQSQPQADLLLQAGGDEHAVVIAGKIEQRLAIDPVIGLDVDAKCEDAVYLLVDDIFGKPELGDAGPQESADLAA